MELILLERVRKLGNSGDIVKVKNGYGRNFLIPQKKAILANELNRKIYEEQKEEIESSNKEKLLEAQELSKKLGKLFIDIINQASEDGRLFGSITPRNIAEEISKKFKIDINRNSINLSQSIKYIGIYEFELALHPEVIEKGYINVARSDTEAKEAKDNFIADKKNNKEE